MSNGLIDFLLQRTGRERMLLGALVLVCLPLLIAFVVVLPLLESQKQAQQDQQEAIALNRWVNARVTELGSYAAAPEVVQYDPIGSSGLEQSLIDAGLRDDVSDLGVLDEGVIELRFDLVPFAALADWISANEVDWGYDISTFRFEATDVEGKVSARLALTPQE